MTQMEKLKFVTQLLQTTQFNCMETIQEVESLLWSLLTANLEITLVITRMTRSIGEIRIQCTPFTTAFFLKTRPMIRHRTIHTISKFQKIIMMLPAKGVDSRFISKVTPKTTLLSCPAVSS